MASSDKSIVAVIPARYGSTRFPAKVLAKIQGKIMIQWVYERVAASKMIDRVIIATDDERVKQAVSEFTDNVVMTSSEHQTGTDRIAEAIQGIDADIVLNVQGDEPLIPTHVLDQLLIEFSQREQTEMATVAVPIKADNLPEDFEDPNVVKVVIDTNSNALYFSRAPIPLARDSRPDSASPLQHWGIYAYHRDFLEKYVKMPQSPLEQCEKLEQLRALENGATIYVLISDQTTVGVDVPEDIDKVEAILAKESND